MEYKEPRIGVILYDVSEGDSTVLDKIANASAVIKAVYPNVCILPTPFFNESRMSRIARIIYRFEDADTLFCNTCGDEIDHLYRFVRAIAKNERLQIIPMKELREQLKRKANTEGDDV